jgi:hypothetical protein
LKVEAIFVSSLARLAIASGKSVVVAVMLTTSCTAAPERHLVPVAACPTVAAPLAIAPCPPKGGGQYACFYSQQNFGGASFCEALGTHRPRLSGSQTAVRSVFVTPGARAKLCSAPDFAGHCSIIRESTGHLDASLDGAVASLKVEVR